MERGIHNKVQSIVVQKKSSVAVARDCGRRSLLIVADPLLPALMQQLGAEVDSLPWKGGRRIWQTRREKKQRRKTARSRDKEYGESRIHELSENEWQ